MTIIETAYYLSGPALVVIAAIGLRQLKIAKDNARLTAKRESLTIAADRCDHFLKQIIPLVDAFDNALEQNSISFFEDAKVEVQGKRVRITAEWSESDMEKMDTLTDKYLPVYNSLEAFATFFTTGVADESVAFESVGHSYCDIVKEYLPDILPLSCDGRYYLNLLELYFLWNERVETIELRSQKRNIENRLKEINNRFIEPLGTK